MRHVLGNNNKEKKKDKDLEKCGQTHLEEWEADFKLFISIIITVIIIARSIIRVIITAIIIIFVIVIFIIISIIASLIFCTVLFLIPYCIIIFNTLLYYYFTSILPI